jgi:hypothetical protein
LLSVCIVVITKGDFVDGVKRKSTQSLRVAILQCLALVVLVSKITLSILHPIPIPLFLSHLPNPTIIKLTRTVTQLIITHINITTTINIIQPLYIKLTINTSNNVQGYTTCGVSKCLLYSIFLWLTASVYLLFKISTQVKNNTQPLYR